MRALKRFLAVPAALAVGLAGCGTDMESPLDPSNESPVFGTVVAASPQGPQANNNRDRQPFVVEFDGASDFSDATAVGEHLGWAQLKRDADGLKAVVHVSGLKPGAVFTFWWVGVQDDATFPDDIFVALGGSAIIGSNGRTTVHLSADKGDASLAGAPFMGGALFGDLRDPLTALVRVEMAYHGQVEDAGDEIDLWRSNFWSGSACPDGGLNDFGQPHCPVYIASTHFP